MKKLILIVLPLMVMFSAFAEGELTKAEKKMLSKHMKSSVKALSKSVKGLSDAQVNFKPDANSWSIKECVYHLALSEDNLWGWMQGLMATPANPEKRSLIKMTNEQLMAAVGSRDHKVKTGEAFEPVKAKWNNLQEALDYLKGKRAEHAGFIKNATSDMHNHVAEQSPVGPIDAFQIIVLLSAHTDRHRKQLEEVKTVAGYPAM
ncbi:MAG: DinB family protein [Bacteroidota bacterium]